MRRQASILFSQLCSHCVRLFFWVARYLGLKGESAAVRPVAGGIRPKAWAWLLRRVGRRTAPPRTQRPVAEALQAREQPASPGRDVPLPPATPDEVSPALHPLQVVIATPKLVPAAKLAPTPTPVPERTPTREFTPASEPEPSPRAPRRQTTQSQTPPRRRERSSVAPRLEPLAPEPSPEESESSATIRGTAQVIPIDLRRVPKPPLQRRIAVIADCENDTVSVEASLRFTGLLSKKGRLKNKACGAHIVHTGDMMHKNAPNAVVVGFWEGLRTAAEAADCCLHLVAGNHELEIWRRLQSGARLGLKPVEQQAVQGLIRTMKLFHVEGSILFIHGYPTLTLLRHMQAYRTDTGKSLNDYNQDWFQIAFDDAKLLTRYAYPRSNVCRESLLHDVPSPARYYRRYGREVAALLSSFGIDLVVHGHRPERSGVQSDYEVQRWLPGIRMINNDTQIRLQGLGATVIRQVESGPTDVLFVNTNNATLAHRAEVRGLLRRPKRAADDSLDLKQMVPDGQVFSFVRNGDLRASGVAAEPQTRQPSDQRFGRV